MAVRIQREVGGNLAELLMTVAETMTARQRLRGEVSALTAEGKISAIVLGILPVGLGGVLFVLNPAYMNVLLHDTLGQIMLGLACFSAGWFRVDEEDHQHRHLRRGWTHNSPSSVPVPESHSRPTEGSRRSTSARPSANRCATSTVWSR